MATLRDHQPIVLDSIYGLFDRGDKDNTPIDHLQDCDNLRAVGAGSFASRYGIGISQDVDVPLTNIRRIYDFPTQTGSTLIVLAYDYNLDEGSIYHVVDSTTVYGPVLTITGMKDFAFLPYDGRGYISPFASQLPTLTPPAPVAAIAVAGSGVDDGSHGYALTFRRGSDETLPSGVTVAVSNSGIANPGSSPGVSIGGGSSPMVANTLTPGATYHWKLAYRTQQSTAPTNGHTLADATSFGLIPFANELIKVGYIGTIPANAYYVDFYRTIANGSTYYYEFTALASDVSSGSLYPVCIPGTTDNDTDIVSNPTEPLSNDTAQEQIDVSNISILYPSDATDKRLYRTEAGGTQLKLLTTLALAATTFTDNTPDASLGVNAPTSNTYVTGTEPIERGLEGEFVYVYLGNGTAARKAAGDPISGTMIVGNGAPGHTDPGIHVFGIVSETNTGYLSPPGALASFVTSGVNSVSFGNIPTSGDPNVVRRHLVASIVIPSAAFTGNLTGYDLFFVPGGTIENNSDTFLNNVSFFDADLLDDASHLFDNYPDIPAGAALSLYHNRMCVFATYTDISLGLVSMEGEPEAISQVSGLIVFPLDGFPITNGQELRDVLYVMKRARTVSFSDNGDDPSSWPMVFIDNALGTPVHGVATVLDSGSSSVDYLIICTYQGISLFNGRYVTPELSWKIESYWRDLDRDQFSKIQIVNDPITKEFYVILPNGFCLVGNYANGMDPKLIRWYPISFAMQVNTIAVTNINEIIFGSDLAT
jgi:hypothetical protein